jgi:hypothetical protein
MFAALAIDGGQAYQSHRQSQNAADTGTMAGVRVLEQLRFHASTTSFTPSDIAVQVRALATSAGADPTADGVQCYLVDSSSKPITFTGSGPTDICSTVLPNTADLSNSYGVRTIAKQSKRTFFAGAAGWNQTDASTSATALIQNFAGGTGSPFIVCGDVTANGYDILTQSAGSWTIKSAAVGGYYDVQNSNVGTCDAPSSKFDGLACGDSIPSLPYDQCATNGNTTLWNVSEQVVGQTPCPSSGVLDGCGILIPLAVDSSAIGSSSDPRFHIVIWGVFQVWGSGSGSYNFNNIAGQPQGNVVGSNCKNPFDLYHSGGMKYCGRLLGTASITGGATSGPGTQNAPHVLVLTE